MKQKSRVINAKQIYPFFTEYKKDNLEKAQYIVKLQDSETKKENYQLFHNGNFIGNKYIEMREVIDKDSNHSAVMCSALKVISDGGEEGYICPIDAEQTLLSNPKDAYIVGSFLNIAGRQIQKYIDTLVNGFKLENKNIDLKYNYSSRINELKMGSTYENGNVCSPIDLSVKLTEFDSEICNVLANNFYELLFDYEWMIRDSGTLSDDLKKVMLTQILPSWEYITIGDLTSINENYLKEIKNMYNEDLSNTRQKNYILNIYRYNKIVVLFIEKK